MTKSASVDFYDVKADLEAVLALTGHKNPIIFNEFEHIALHPGQCSSLIRQESNGDQSIIGYLGRLHPMLEKQYGVNNVFVFEVDLDIALKAELPAFKAVSKFPSIKRDLSVLVSEEVAVAKLMSSLRDELGEALIKVELFDVYRGDGVADGVKSISLSLVLQDQGKTMTDEDAEVLMSKALSFLEASWGAILRS